MSYTNQQIVTLAFQKAGIVDETQQPNSVQGANGLQILNSYLLARQRAGLRVGWWTQTNLAATFPLRDEDAGDIVLLLTAQLSFSYSAPITDPVLAQEISNADKRLLKAYFRIPECDFSDFPRPQGGPWGGPNWI